MGSMAINIVAMVALGIVALCHATPQWTMESFIAAVEQVEEWDPEMGVLSVLKTLRRFGGLDDPFVRHFLGAPSETPLPTIPSEASDFLRSAISHRVTEAEEEGVVLTGDGTTVALAPLVLGAEAGLLAPSGLYPLALARTLGLAFLRPGTPLLRDGLGPGGCWDNVTSPHTFTLSGPPTPATDAVVNGGMDGVILGAELSGRAPEPRPQLSGLLRLYYQHRLQGAGLSSAPGLISPRRRENFRTLVSPALLQDQVRESLALHRLLTAHPGPEEGQESEAVLRAGVELFVHRYMDCPAIIPRCQWGAEPYRGTPTQLALPLSFLYVHHTYQPGQPCLSFNQCAADMRAMQRFHQDDRGWDDIGYSFVVGSDGYVYEGRGWQWRGAHTKGHNSLGYGVSFIGDYTASLPSTHALALARDRLTACAVGGARLTANYTVHGHRQLVNTSCPGDALFAEVKGWPHFREVEVKP